MNRRKFAVGMVMVSLSTVIATIPIHEPHEIELPEQYNWKWWFDGLKTAMEENFGIVLKPTTPEWTLCEGIAHIHANNYKVQNELIKSFLRTEEIFK